MKFSKLLTTAMMSVALVASSSALATETSWWSMNFDGLSIEEGGSLTNTLNTAYGTDQNGVWSTEEGDLSSLADGKLVLNTQGTDLTWTPNGDNDETAITYIDATVKFVGSDTAPTISEKDVHTAVYLKNIIDDETGEIASSVLCAWARPGGDDPTWVELVGEETVSDQGEYRLRIMLDGNVLTFFINEAPLTLKDDTTGKKLFTAKESDYGEVNSVSFRGTGSVDYFAASQNEKVSAGTANIDVSALWNDKEIDSEVYHWSYDIMSENPLPTSLNLDSPSSELNVLPYLYEISQDELLEDAATQLTSIGVSVNDNSETLIEYSEETGWPEDATIVVTVNDEDGTYIATIDHTAFVDGDNVKVVFYYGTHTASEDPDPKPVQLGTPSVTVTTTANSVTLTWTAVTNATGYVVTFNGETTTVTDATFTASDLKASTDYTYSVVAKGDGVNYTDSVAASGTATTAAAEVTVVEPDPIKISAISGPVEGNVVVTVVPATEGGKIKAGVNYWAVVSATLGGDETAQDPVTVPEDTDSLQITVPATGDSLFIKVKADTATAK